LGAFPALYGLIDSPVLRDFPGLRRAAFFPQRAQYFARISGRTGNRAFRSNLVCRNAANKYFRFNPLRVPLGAKNDAIDHGFTNPLRVGYRKPEAPSRLSRLKPHSHL
jgi:hypothetical protein